MPFMPRDETTSRRTRRRNRASVAANSILQSLAEMSPFGGPTYSNLPWERNPPLDPQTGLATGLVWGPYGIEHYYPEAMASGSPEYNRYMGGLGEDRSPLNQGNLARRGKPSVDNVTAGVAGAGGGRQSDLYGALWNQLVRSAKDVPVIDYDELIRKSVGAIRKSYKPEIKGLRRDIGSTQKESEASQEEINALYAGLTKTQMKKARKEPKLAREQRQRITTEEGNRMAATSNAYMEDANKTAEILRGMGADEAADNLMKQVYGQRGGAIERIQAGAQSERQAATVRGNRNKKFYDRLAQSSRLEGNQTIGAIAQQEADIIADTRQQIAGLRGARGREIAATRMGLEQAEAEQNVAANQQVWDRLFGLQGAKMDIENLQFSQDQATAQLLMQQQQMVADQQAAAQEAAGENPFDEAMANNMSDALTLLRTGFKDKGARKAATEYLKGFLRSEPMRVGEIPNPHIEGESINYSPLMAAEDARQDALRRGFNKQQAEIIYQSVLSFMSKGKG